MEKRCGLVFLAAALVAVMFLSSPASGISDFGGPCKRNVDCATGLCSKGICSTEGPCANLKLDNGEADVDCGGVCAEVKNQTCALGKRCVENSDCSSGICGSGSRCINQTGAKGQTAAVKAKSSARSSGGGFVEKATLFLVVIALVMFAAVALLSFLRNRKGKAENDLPPLRHSPGRKTPPSQPPQQREQETVSLHHPQQEQPAQHRSPHAVFEGLERTYSRLSGEELFEHLRRKRGRR